MQRHILDNLLLLMHITFRHRYVLLGLEVEFRGVGVAAADALAGARVGFDVDDVADGDALFLDCFVDGGVETEFFGAFARFQADEEVGDGAAVAAEGVFGFFGGELDYFAFVDFFCFANAEA